jgi:hypothetical protein
MSHLKDENRLSVTVSAMRKIFWQNKEDVTGSLKKSHNVELDGLYSLTS